MKKTTYLVVLGLLVPCCSAVYGLDRLPGHCLTACDKDYFEDLAPCTGVDYGSGDGYGTVVGSHQCCALTGNVVFGPLVNLRCVNLDGVSVFWVFENCNGQWYCDRGDGPPFCRSPQYSANGVQIHYSKLDMTSGLPDPKYGGSPIIYYDQNNINPVQYSFSVYDQQGVVRAITLDDERKSYVVSTNDKSVCQ